MSEYTPDYVSHPGATLNEIINDLGVNCEEIGHLLGLDGDVIRGIVFGTFRITDLEASRLSEYGGKSFWMKREARYREFLDSHGIAARKAYYSVITVKDGECIYDGIDTNIPITEKEAHVSASEFRDMYPGLSFEVVEVETIVRRVGVGADFDHVCLRAKDYESHEECRQAVLSMSDKNNFVATYCSPCNEWYIGKREK